MIYTSCKYVPVEIFAGFGEKAERLDPHPASFSCADGCSHPNLCGFAKAIIEEVKARKIRELILVDCCDAMRRTYDVLKQDEMDFLYFLPLPHKTGEREIRYFAAQLQALKDKYEAYSGRPFSVRAAAAALLEGVKDASEDADALLEGVKAASEDAADTDVRAAKGQTQEAVGTEACCAEEVVVMGAHGGGEVLKSVQAAFPKAVVKDATCSGNRVFAEGAAEAVAAAFAPGAACAADGQKTAGGQQAPGGQQAAGGQQIPDGRTEADFFRAYAELLLKKLPPCMRMLDIRERGSLAAGEGGRPRGIVYHTMRFCDYYSFEYAEMKNREDVPLLKIETDTTPLSAGQIKTRIEAFAEMTGGERDMEAAAHTVNKARAESEKARYKYAAGIDSGSASTDAVILDEKLEIVGSAVIPTGMSASRSARLALQTALKQAGISESELGNVVTTGYGREVAGKTGASGAVENAIDASSDGTAWKAVTEITCHARGARYLYPEVRTVIDIGGQDSKVIRLADDGSVASFVMNDKCAAGTGRFLEMQARALDITLDKMSRAGLDWKNAVRISNMCTVFAESEVVSLVARDVPLPDIIHGLNVAVAEKTASLVARSRGVAPFMLTGGVSKNEGVVQCLREVLGEPVHTSARSQLCGAIGAALIAMTQ